MRFCVNYRKVNNVTIRNSYPIPKIDDILNGINKCKIFTSLDLSSGYHQIKLDNASSPITAFITPNGLYQFITMPFNLTNAPATFQSLMNLILQPYINNFCMVYLNDIIIFSKTIKEHLLHVKKVIKKLKKANL